MIAGIYRDFAGKSECGDFKFMGIACIPAISVIFEVNQKEVWTFYIYSLLRFFKFPYNFCGDFRCTRNPRDNYMHFTGYVLRHRDPPHFLWGKDLQCRPLYDKQFLISVPKFWFIWLCHISNSCKARSLYFNILQNYTHLRRIISQLIIYIDQPSNCKMPRPIERFMESVFHETGQKFRAGQIFYGSTCCIANRTASSVMMVRL